jgi:hypothetical protein
MTACEICVTGDVWPLNGLVLLPSNPLERSDEILGFNLSPWHLRP